MSRIPFMVVGDGPADPTGLGRIARDLCALLSSDAEALGIDLVQVGGTVPPVWTAWRHVPLDRSDDWGEACAARIWDSLWGQERGVLLMVWDPSRLAAYHGSSIPAARWAYPAVDAVGLAGGISGPAGEAVAHLDRVLAYGRFGAKVLQTVRAEPVPSLPHGISASTWNQPMNTAETEWTTRTLGAWRRRDSWLLGCVAANQARKDLAWYFQTLAELRKRGHKVHGWLHSDVLVKENGHGWSIPQLVSETGVAKYLTVTMDTYTDRQMALLYQACAVTMAPGLGEGFGYPVVESLASGVPCVIGDYAGAVELIPKTEWRVPVRAKRIEGVYAQVRPVFTAEDAANAIQRVRLWQQSVGPLVSAEYCKGSVAHLDWMALWPRWKQWILDGLEAA